MKYFIICIAGFTMFTYSISAISAERLHAHYEVNFDDGTSVRTVRTSCYVTPGTPVAHELGEYKLSLTIETGQANQYSLTVALAQSATMPDADAPLMQRSFAGQLADTSNGPLEFKMQQDALTVYGAISLLAIEE